MLGRTLKMAFWLFHDHLGSLVLSNLISAIAIALPLSFALPALSSGDPYSITAIALPLCSLAGFIVAPICATAMAHMLKVFLDTRDGGIADFFAGVRKHALRAAGAGGLCGIGMTALLSSAWFYTTRMTSFPMLGYALAGLALGSALVLTAVAVYIPPALVQRKTGVLQTIRLTLYLALANPGLTAGLLLQILLVTALATLFWPLAFIGYLASILCLTSAAYELLSRKYAATAGEESPPDAMDDYLNRGLRDLFFPWKG